jgi:hypothetical protein
LEQKRQVKDAAVAPKLRRQPAPAEDGKHRLIFGEHFCIEPR